jgi:penicillin-binding protein 2
MPLPAIATVRQNRTVGRLWQPYILLIALSLGLFGFLGSRLAYLQLVDGHRNHELADENRIRLLPRNPERGRILDRNGQVLASSKLTYSLYVWPLALKDPGWSRSLQTLARVLKMTPKAIAERTERRKVRSNYRIALLRNLNPQQIIALEEVRHQLVGVEVDVDTVRYYPHGTLAAHALGYTGEVTEAELKALKPKGYRLGDVVGVMGVERVYEPQLRGQWGGQQVEVDAMGNIMRILGEKKARAGQDLHLTIDLPLQEAAEAALGSYKGAIVALDPRDGSILALVSRPAFNPNWFSLGLSETEWNRLQSLDTPFVNRALQGFPPASTFKIITTTAALESERLSPQTILPTFGNITVGGITFWEHNKVGFGSINFPTALAVSSDTFFYQVGMRTGPEEIFKAARRFGFGSHTGFELNQEESPGLLGDRAWKKRALGEDWYMGDTVSIAIGQGPLQITPLQLARMYAAVANGGYLVVPHMVQTKTNFLAQRRPIHLKPSTLATLRAGLRQVVTNGTAGVLNDPALPPVAGKTGTAEDPPRPDHAWFGGYAPVDHPQIVVVAFAENCGGHGGSTTAPMVHKMLQVYFRQWQKPASKPLLNR